ncbi:MAG: AI-2E family transporter [Anaerorhabdus sp.]
MKFNKKDLINLKPWLILATYCIVLIAIVFAIPNFINSTMKFLKLFTPLFYGLGIAFVLNIPMAKIEKFLKNNISEKIFIYKRIRSISVLLTLVLTFVLFYVFITIITPQLISSLYLLLSNAGTYITSIVDNINNMLDYINLEYDVTIDQSAINSFLYSQGYTLEKLISNTGSWALGTGTSIINNTLAFTSELMTWFTAFMLSLYLLAKKEIFIYQFKKVVYAIFGFKISTTIIEWGNKTNYIFGRFVTGQLLEACILGTIYFVVLTLLNFPFAMLISCIIAVTSIVPMFGAMFGMAVGCLLILAVRPLIDTFFFILVFQAVQTFEGNLIYPRVVGKSVGLPGIWVLLSLIILGSLWGLFGMLIAVPFTAVVYKILVEIINFVLKKRKIKVTTNNVTNEKM